MLVSSFIPPSNQHLLILEGSACFVSGERIRKPEIWPLYLHFSLSVMSKLHIWAVGWVMGREGQGLFECKLPKTWWLLLKLMHLSAALPLHALQKYKINSKGQMSEFCPLVSKSQQQLKNPNWNITNMPLFLLSEVSHPEVPACFSPNWTFTCNFNFLWKSLTKQ